MSLGGTPKTTPSMKRWMWAFSVFGFIFAIFPEDNALDKVSCTPGKCKAARQNNGFE